MSTTLVKPAEVERKWYLLDAAGKSLGHVAAEAAVLLRGKQKVDYTPNVDCGDFVVVINCDKAVLTGKKAEQKFHITHSKFIGGLKKVQYSKLMAENSDLAMTYAVKGMIPFQHHRCEGSDPPALLPGCRARSRSSEAREDRVLRRRQSNMYETKPYFYGTGRRKDSVARVRVYQGTGKVTINDRDIDNYFGLETLKLIVRSPLVLLGLEGKYDVVVRVSGGGVSGQAGAIRHGLSRALLQQSDENRTALKKAGFLTRDPRMKERKKYGLKAARRAPQFSKR